jgi:hypothetical protein
MHIHHNPIAAGGAGVHSAAAAEKAASAQRAAEVRKKLMTSAAGIKDEPNFGEFLMVGRWPDERSGRHQEQPQPRHRQENQAEDEALATPVSYWA